ncbi:hypothetical protein BV898_00854 [Hypsibius exemplaris]|uniref:F-box domain-containing protein n=1 Tax=Hypsibius exemplaris TaxID=2072580 RepID=A0A1W0XCF0_HYPEX|nr:hypothetical protein BV898_00854 [Hypsibius exemplaris]
MGICYSKSPEVYGRDDDDSPDIWIQKDDCFTILYAEEEWRRGDVDEADDSAEPEDVLFSKTDRVFSYKKSYPFTENRATTKTNPLGHNLAANSTAFKDLPLELLCEIFALLDVPHQLRLQRVGKHWNSVLRMPVVQSRVHIRLHDLPLPNLARPTSTVTDLSCQTMYNRLQDQLFARSRDLVSKYVSSRQSPLEHLLLETNYRTRLLKTISASEDLTGAYNHRRAADWLELLTCIRALPEARGLQEISFIGAFCDTHRLTILYTSFPQLLRINFTRCIAALSWLDTGGPPYVRAMEPIAQHTVTGRGHDNLLAAFLPLLSDRDRWEPLTSETIATLHNLRNGTLDDRNFLHNVRFCLFHFEAAYGNCSDPSEIELSVVDWSTLRCITQEIILQVVNGYRPLLRKTNC